MTYYFNVKGFDSMRKFLAVILVLVFASMSCAHPGKLDANGGHFDKETGEYSQDFGGYVRMVGQAHKAMDHLQEKDSFKIVRCGVENHYNKEKKITYNNFVIFEVEIDDSYPATSADLGEDNPFLS